MRYMIKFNREMNLPMLYNLTTHDRFKSCLSCFGDIEKVEHDFKFFFFFHHFCHEGLPYLNKSRIPNIELI